jgi:hypothetical protein
MNRAAHDAGQAIIMVIALSVLLMTVGVMLVQQTIETDPLLQSDSIAHAAYRGLEAGMNSYQSIVNTNPNLANCNKSTNWPGGINALAVCQGAQYQTWNLVSNTTGANGTIPEWYLFDNPQPVFNADGSLASLQVQIVGVAGFPNHYAYQSSVANMAPVNGFLTVLWWSDFEASDTKVSNPIYRGSQVFTDGVEASNTTFRSATAGFTAADVGQPIIAAGIPANTTITVIGSATSVTISQAATATATGVNFSLPSRPGVCDYNWANGYGGPGGNCDPVSFGPSDTINGPVFSNDSIYVTNGNGSTGPNFGAASPWSSVKTQDPLCIFTDPACPLADSTDVGHYAALPVSADNQPHQTPPADDSSLAKVAAIAYPNNGCVYYGPTTIVLAGSQMTVTSLDTKTASTGCPLGATAGNLPPNGVVYVQDAVANSVDYPNSQLFGKGANPFDDYPPYFSSSDNQKYAQTFGNYNITVGTWPQQATYSMPGYFGWTGSGSQDSEGDAFVSGSLGASSTVAGDLMIGTSNDIIIDGSSIMAGNDLTYADCSTTPTNYWVGTAQKSACKYRTDGKNDALGLIANHYIEVDHPIYPTAQGGHAQYSALPVCASGSLAPPLCQPVDSSNNVTIDAAILALTQSFGVNNYVSGSQMGNLVLYGSLQQEARGAVGALVGTNTYGFSKYYTWDPRLELVAPPSYLNPGTASYNLNSSGISSSLGCPLLFSVYSVPNQTPTVTCPAVPALPIGIPTNVVANSPPSPRHSQSVTFTATITGPSGGPTPTGALTWTLTGPVTSCTSTTGPTGSSNVATYTCVMTTALSYPGTYSATATYPGDGNYYSTGSNIDTFSVSS